MLIDIGKMKYTAKKNGRKPKLLTAIRQTFIWSFLYYGEWILFMTSVLRYYNNHNVYLCVLYYIYLLLKIFLYKVMQPYLLGLLWHFDSQATSTQKEAYLHATGVIIIEIMQQC